MSEKLAIKKLTASDLTFFEWQFREHNVGNQKGVNLNADVFIEALYPSLPQTPEGIRGKIPLDLFLYGPGHAGEFNVQRKIIKRGSYKNWRLNGEFIHESDAPGRFNAMVPGDFVILDFIGDLVPHTCKAVMLAKSVPQDSALHEEIGKLFGTTTMISMSTADLTRLVSAAGSAAEHPVHELTLEADLEDAAMGGAEGTRNLQRRPSGRRMSAEDLERARQRAEEIGRIGEEFVNAHLDVLKRDGEIHDYEWASQSNAVSPYDFRVSRRTDTEDLIDAKSTAGAFSRRIHVSLNELREMETCAGKYAIYRVYEIEEKTAKLRIADDLSDLATTVLGCFESLPHGVVANGVSIRPESLAFAEETVLDLPDVAEEE